VRDVFVRFLIFTILYFSLDSNNSSWVATFSTNTGSFVTSGPTAIAEDLLRYTNSPCMLFVKWSSEPNNVLKEAKSLCFEMQVLQSANSLKQHLETNGVAGDAVPSTGLSTWYKLKYAELEQASMNYSIFDPTILVVETISDLITSIAKTHQFDIANQNVLIPLTFVRTWAVDLTARVKNDPSLISKMTCKH
jgi:hypothetical protein